MPHIAELEILLLGFDSIHIARHLLSLEDHAAHPRKHRETRGDGAARHAVSRGRCASCVRDATQWV